MQEPVGSWFFERNTRAEHNLGILSLSKGAVAKTCAVAASQLEQADRPLRLRLPLILTLLLPLSLSLSLDPEPQSGAGAGTESGAEAGGRNSTPHPRPDAIPWPPCRKDFRPSMWTGPFSSSS